MDKLELINKLHLFYKKTFNSEVGYTVINNFNNKKQLIIGVLVNKKKIISIPHFSYSIIITHNKNLESKLERQDIKFLNDNNIQSSDLNVSWEIRSFHKFSNYYDDSKVISYLKLKESIDYQLKYFSTSIRSNLKKASRFGFVVKRGLLELIDDFYYVYTRNMYRLGSPNYSKEFFTNLIKIYSDCLIIIVYKDNLPIACAFLVQYKSCIEMCWASSLSNYNNQNVNYALYWDSIKYAIEKECIYFSFGRSTINSPSYKFKHHWNPIEKTLYYNYSHPKKLNIKSLKFLAKFWKLVPFSLAVKIGPYLIKKIY